MVVAVVAMVVVQVAPRPVVDVRSVGHGRVPAAGAVLVPLGMDAAFVAGLALLRVARRHVDDVVVDVVAVLVVHVAVVQVVLVPVVHDLVMAAAVRMVMVVRGMLLAGVHGGPARDCVRRLIDPSKPAQPTTGLKRRRGPSEAMRPTTFWTLAAVLPLLAGCMADDAPADDPA